MTVKAPQLIVPATSYTLRRGQTVILKATAVPAARIIYTSLKPVIAEVDSSGRVIARNIGTAKICIRANGLEKYVTINVIN